MSRITAPVGEVTTPLTPGRKGSRRLRALSNSPSAVSLRRRSSRRAFRAPMPAGSSESTTIW
jgi:hypothetical protein